MAGHQFLNTRKESLRTGQISKRQIFRQCSPAEVWAHARTEQNFYLRPEDELLVIVLVVERFYSQAVARDEQMTLPAVHDVESKQATQMEYATVSLLFLNINRGLRIGESACAMAPCIKIREKAASVI